MTKTKKTIFTLLLTVALCVCMACTFAVGGTRPANAASEQEYEIGSVTLQSGTNSYEDYTGTVSTLDFNLPKAYRSNENSWWDYAAYGFSFDKFKAQSLGISDYTNESEVSAVIGTYQEPGTAVPFEICYTGCLSLGQNTVIYSIGNGSAWVFSAAIDTYTGTWTLSGSGISGSPTFAIGQDYNTDSYGGNARHVLRIFVDYTAGKIIVANANSTGYAVVDCNFAAFTEQINYVRFNSQAAGSGFTPCVWVESIMGDNNLDGAITFEEDLPETVSYGQTVEFPAATISYLTQNYDASIVLTKPNASVVTEDFTFDQYGVYNLRYSYDVDGKLYYKDYKYVIDDPVPVEMDDADITLSSSIPESCVYGEKCTLPSVTFNILGEEKVATAKITYPSENVVERQIFRAVEAGEYTITYFVFDNETGKTYKKDYTLTVATPQASEVKVAEAPLFVGVEPDYCEYPYENNNSDFGYGYLGTILGSYGTFGFSFDLEDFKKLTFDESKSIGTLTNPNQTPFVVLYAVPSSNNAEDATGMSIRLGNADSHIYSNWMNTSDLNLCLIRESDGKAVIEGENGTGYVEREDGNIEVPQQVVDRFNARVAGDVEWSVLRVYVDYESGYIYFANGADQTVDNMVKHPCDFKSFDKDALNRFDICPWGVSETNGLSFMFAEIFGKQPTDAFITMYGKLKTTYNMNSEVTFPRAEIGMSGEYYSCVVDVLNSEGDKLADSVKSYTFTAAGEYTLRYHYTVNNTDYYREYKIDVANVTEITVVAPTPSTTTIKVGDNLPELSGSTEGGYYRWKEGQTVVEGEKEYVWEFVPTNTSDSVEYTNISGKIKITATAQEESASGGCAGCSSSMASSAPILVLSLAMATLFVAIKSKKRKS